MHLLKVNSLYFVLLFRSACVERQFSETSFMFGNRENQVKQKVVKDGSILFGSQLWVRIIHIIESNSFF